MVCAESDDFALIPAGDFQMGDQSNPQVGSGRELPVHSVYVSAFYMGKYEVTKELWDEVQAWGLLNGYTDLSEGNGGHASKGENHPVYSITWHEMVKWCNARSAKENQMPCYTVWGETYKTGVESSVAVVCNFGASGYRLPTEAEWEKAARGGQTGYDFPWGTNTIGHSEANYLSYPDYAYDTSLTRGHHPSYTAGGSPYTAPVDSFAPNGYGLYNMSGNVWEWCWDWYGGTYYSDSAAGTNPRGLYYGTFRVKRGGAWGYDAFFCRVADRQSYRPSNSYADVGFRLARSVPAAITTELHVGTNPVDGSADLAFGYSSIDTSETKTVMVRNTGSTDLTGLAVSCNGANASDFVLSALDTTTLAAGADTSFTVTFTPFAEGSRTAMLQIVSNNANANQVDITLGGTGVVGPAIPEIVVEEPVGVELVNGAAAFAFGNANIGTSVTKWVTVSNTGTDYLTGLAVSRSGTNASDFTLGVLGATTLAPGAKTTFTVTFGPTAVGFRSAALEITSNDADENPSNIILGGTGVSVEPYDISFVGTPYELRVGNTVAFDLKRLIGITETIKVTGKIPPGLKFNATTGMLAGTLTGKPGVYQTVINVYQGKTLAWYYVFSITILEFPSSLLGNFDCLLEDSNSVPTGIFKITITSANQWSATLETAGANKKRSAKGSFILAEGSPVAPITAVFPSITGAPAVTVNISINGSTPNQTGVYNTGTLRGFRLAKADETPPATMAYSLVLDSGAQDGITIPAGLGWMKGNVSNKGISNFRGLLGDGRSASFTLQVSACGQAILWSQPYTNKNSFIGGIVTLANLGQASPSVPLLSDGAWWAKSADAKTLSYPSGFNAMPVTVRTSRWTTPPSATALGATLGWRDNRKTEVILDGGGLNNQESQVTTVALPTEFTLDDKFALITSLPATLSRVAWKGSVAKSTGGIIGTLTLPRGFSVDVPVGGTAAASGVLVHDAAWGIVTGCGLVKVPTDDPKGSFRTSAFRLAQ